MNDDKILQIQVVLGSFHLGVKMHMWVLVCVRTHWVSERKGMEASEPWDAQAKVRMGLAYLTSMSLLLQETW